MATPAAATRKDLVATAKQLGLKVFKSQSDEEIEQNVAEALDKPGLAKFKTLTEEQIAKADSIRIKLNVINRLEDCFGFGFASESQACRDRCRQNDQCARLLIASASALAIDEEGRAAAEKAHRASGTKEAFKPKPMLAYAKEVETAKVVVKSKTAIEWLLIKKDAKKLAKSLGLDVDMIALLADLRQELTTYREFKSTVEAYNESAEQDMADIEGFLKRLVNEGFLRFA